MSAFLFVTDLDNTLVGDESALAELNQRLSRHREEYGTKIVYATGRSHTSFRALQQTQPLLEPDALIAAVGTEIYYQGSETPDADWVASLTPGWDRDTVMATTAHFSDLVLQPDTEQRPFKVSFLLTETVAEELLPRLEQSLRDRGLDIQLIYSSGQDLDIVPQKANKGQAMHQVEQHWNFAPTQTVACGDSGNDCALFSVGEERGILVGNARPELLEWHQHQGGDRHYLAKSHCAAGILEGLTHFGFL